MGRKNFTLSINALNQCFSICGPWPTGGPQNILLWATEHFGKSRIFEKSCLKFLFPGDNLFLAGKSARILVKIFFSEITLFSAGNTLRVAMENFQNQNGPRL